MPRTNAWLLDFGPSCRAAVGERVLLHLIDQPQIKEVADAPPHCLGMLSWQGNSLPVIDLSIRLGLSPPLPKLLAVVGYQERRGDAPSFGALVLAAAPVKITIDDNQACALPPQPAGWKELALSCFEHQQNAIPILHLGKVFSGLTELDERNKQ